MSEGHASTPDDGLDAVLPCACNHNPHYTSVRGHLVWCPTNHHAAVRAWAEQVAERARDEGYARGTRDAEMDYEPADNPYRADRIAGAET